MEPKSPKYIECLEALTGLEKGKIYPCVNNLIIDGKYNNYRFYFAGKYVYFKPSTKKEYNIQNKTEIKTKKQNTSYLIKFLNKLKL